ncbi:MAG: PEGA domain-containing protein [Methanoregula sp.]|nr:PEGA domain-containing protein [Methanoregula sp.]
MKKKLTSLLMVLMLCAIGLVAITTATDAEDDSKNPAIDNPDLPGPISEPIPIPTTTRTTEPTPVPTTEPTTIRTTEPTPTHTETIVSTTVPTTEPTKIPTTTVTTAHATTEPTITIEPTQIGGGVGYFDVYVNVNGATVTVAGNVAGTTPPNPVTAEVYSTGAPATITVTAPNYVTWSQTPGNPPEGQHVRIDATLIPIVTTSPTTPPVQNGAIYAQSSPSGAAISMNGNFYGYAPVTIPNLAPGTYSMRATMSGYTTDSQLVNVYAGQTAYYSPSLQPSPQPPRNTGTVYVTSSPTAALIYVDGNYNGKTPNTLTLYPGSHSFVIKMSGYNDYTTNVYVNAGQAQNLPVTLTPAIFGSVVITSMPGATVYMDSNSQGKIGSGGTLTLPSVTSGNHIFKVSQAGYNDWINTVYIQPNYQNTITAVLTPIGPNPTQVPATGGLNIVSSPSGAETYVDNLYKGYTPAMLTGITPGVHSITLKYTGYVDSSASATVNAGQTTPVAITMTAAPVPTPTPKSAASPVIMIGGLVAILGIGMAIRRRK